MTFRSNDGQKKNRPDIKFEIFKTTDKSIWKMFAKHHYLSHNHNNAAQVYLAYINNQLAGFISILHLPNRDKTIKKVHRLVILPDYQGLSIGVKLLNDIGKIYKKDGWRFTIVTSSPSLMFSLKRQVEWVCKNIGRLPSQNIVEMKKTQSINRLTNHSTWISNFSPKSNYR